MVQGNMLLHMSFFLNTCAPFYIVLLFHVWNIQHLNRNFTCGMNTNYPVKIHCAADRSENLTFILPSFLTQKGPILRVNGILLNSSLLQRDSVIIM